MSRRTTTVCDECAAPMMGRWCYLCGRGKTEETTPLPPRRIGGPLTSEHLGPVHGGGQPTIYWPSDHPLHGLDPMTTDRVQTQGLDGIRALHERGDVLRAQRLILRGVVPGLRSVAQAVNSGGGIRGVHLQRRRPTPCNRASRGIARSAPFFHAHPWAVAHAVNASTPPLACTHPVVHEVNGLSTNARLRCPTCERALGFVKCIVGSSASTPARRRGDAS